MPDPGFAVELDLPFACQAGAPTPALRHGSLLLLRVVNLFDSHDAEGSRDQERVEARLDLMLHWLGMQLFGAEPMPPSQPLRLENDRITWPGAAPSEGDAVTLRLHIHPGLPAPLFLGGRVVERADGHTVAVLSFDDDKQADAWSQWLFRQHRRAVQEARKRNGPD